MLASTQICVCKQIYLTFNMTINFLLKSVFHFVGSFIYDDIMTIMKIRVKTSNLSRILHHASQADSCSSQMCNRRR